MLPSSLRRVLIVEDDADLREAVGRLLRGWGAEAVVAAASVPEAVDRIGASHGSEWNELLCAICLVNSFDVNAQDTGDFLFTATGHLFKAIPCVDADGIPTADDSCGMNVDERTFDHLDDFSSWML